jgi:hypothetical protein
MLIALENEGRYGTMISRPSLMAAGNDVRGGPAVADATLSKEIANACRTSEKQISVLGF